MSDTISREQRSALMGRIKSSGNATTELRFIKIMRRFGINGWRRKSRIFGKPDFVFPKVRVAVFIDGDFWHRHPHRFRMPKSNKAYWRRKIARNVARDKEVNAALRRDGWDVIRFWESVLPHEEAVAARLTLVLGVSRAKADPTMLLDQLSRTQG